MQLAEGGQGVGPLAVLPEQEPALGVALDEGARAPGEGRPAPHERLFAQHVEAGEQGPFEVSLVGLRRGEDRDGIEALGAEHLLHICVAARLDTVDVRELAHGRFRGVGSGAQHARDLGPGRAQVSGDEGTQPLTLAASSDQADPRPVQGRGILAATPRRR